MKFFVDTAIVAEIVELNAYGLLDGVTTNPSLIARSGRALKDVIVEICATVSGPVSAEVVANTAHEMIIEGEKLATFADNVVIKLPLTLEGLKACRHFSQKGIKTNVTLCFSANQALLAAKAGATYVSPFLGRLDDLNIDGMQLIRDICKIYRNYGFTTQVLAASIRTPNHVKEAALAGADVATIPASVIKSLAAHVLTDKGLDQFAKDWAASAQAII